MGGRCCTTLLRCNLTGRYRPLSWTSSSGLAPTTTPQQVRWDLRCRRLPSVPRCPAAIRLKCCGRTRCSCEPFLIWTGQATPNLCTLCSKERRYQDDATAPSSRYACDLSVHCSRGRRVFTRLETAPLSEAGIPHPMGGQDCDPAAL